MRYIWFVCALLWMTQLPAVTVADMEALESDIAQVEQQIADAKAAKDNRSVVELRKAKTDLQKQLRTLKRTWSEQAREQKKQHKQMEKRAAAERTWEGYPPEQQLCSAIEYNRLDLVKKVVESGAVDLSVANSVCYFPLGDAGARGHIEIVRYLLDKNSPMEMPFPHMNTVFSAIDLTAGSKVDQTAILDLLKAHQGHLGHRAENNISMMVKTDKPEEKAYLEQKFNLHQGDLATGSSLIKAMKQAHLNNIKWLLEQGANPAEVSLGKTALQFAIDSRDTEKVKLLVQFGADVNQAGIGFVTPLKYAEDQFNHASKKRKPHFLAIIDFLKAQGAE